MPNCDSVNEVNTPTAYSGIRCVTSPFTTTSRVPASTASTITPLEKTSRSPRLNSWRGRNPSRAMIDDSRGKSA